MGIDRAPTQPHKSHRHLFVVAPAYNEGESLSRFLASLKEAAHALAESVLLNVRAVVVDDGSSDETFRILCEAAQAHSLEFSVTGLQLSRNFGQQAAIQAGLEWAYSKSDPGDLFVIMDSDLQHRPALLREIVTALEQGADHVQMVRQDAGATPFAKRVTSTGFYWLMRCLSKLKLPEGGSDFRGFSRGFLGAYLTLHEKERFNRGLFYWLGFQRREIPYRADNRLGGDTKYSWGKMARLALTGILSFSSRPLVLLCSVIVLGSFLFCGGYLLFEVVRFVAGRKFVVGWPTVLFFVSFWSGAIGLSQLLLALYIARIYEEVKARPVYMVSRIVGAADREKPDGEAEIHRNSVVSE
jgi:glycosyltransferase involved in cell wall biosynthesis